MTLDPTFDDHPTPYVEAREQGRYRGVCTEVVDGDTLGIDLDLGVRVTAHKRIRLADIDTAEIYGVDHDSAEYERGIEAKELVADLALGQPVLAKTTGEESFNRFVGHIWVYDDGWQSLAPILKAQGFG